MHLIKYTILGIIAAYIYSYKLSPLLNTITIFIFSTCIVVDLLLLLHIHINRPALYEKIQQEKFYKPKNTLKTKILFDYNKEIDNQIIINRYHKQELFHQIGIAKQSHLKEKTIVIVGLGSLGTITAELLARAGVGTIHLIDDKRISLHDIKYGPLYNHKDLNESKADICEKKLYKINSDIKIIAHNVRLHKYNIPLLQSNVVLDCTSEIKTKIKINKYCSTKNIPLISSSISKNKGLIFPIKKRNECFDCLTKNNKPIINRENATLPALKMGAGILATKTLKKLLNKSLKLEMIEFDSSNLTIEKIRIKTNIKCDICE